ncbi:MAG TPA: HPr family phosphocarrier protein [Rhodospirillales bacterium]|nr:HPr family phosphocarrier protein [Rhodospirillales bacterium]
MTTPDKSDGQVFSRLAPILNTRGLHARAAAKFVKTASAYDARIVVSRGGQDVSGNSIMGLMMLAASPGCEIEISCSGDQAEAALSALTGLVAAKFDED